VYGLHFTDPTSGLGLAYGHATWIDAEGTRTAVPARWDGDEIVLEVPAATVTASRFPAVLDPLVSGEVVLGVPAARPPAEGAQTDAAIACKVDECLVAWSDVRTGSYNQRAVYATRVNAEGTILDPVGIAVSLGSHTALEPAVATDGTNYAVAFTLRSGATSILILQRVHADGTLGLSKPITSSSDPGVFPSQAALAFGNGRYLAAWAQGSRVRVHLRDASTLEGIFFSNGVGQNVDQSSPAVTYVAASNQFYLAYAAEIAGSSWDVQTANVSWTNGAPLTVRTAGGGVGQQLRPDVASDGTSAMVVWDDRRTGSTSEIRANRATFSGTSQTLQNGNGFLVRGGTWSEEASIGFQSGGSYVVAWEEASDLRGTRMTAGGTLLDSPPVILANGSGSQESPDVAGWASPSFISHMVASNDDTEVRATRTGSFFGWGAFDFPGLLASSSPPLQRDAAVASDGERFLVAYEQADDVYAALVELDAAGLPVVLTTIPVSTVVDVGKSHRRLPDVAFDGTHFVVVWTDQRQNQLGDLRAARITTDGVLLDPEGILLLANNLDDYLATIAATPTRWLVTYRSDVVLGAASLRASTFTTSGQPLASATLTAADGLNWGPDVASDGTNFFVAWQARNGAEGYNVYGARVSAAGVAGPAQFLAGAAGDQGQVKVAFGSTTYQVVLTSCQLLYSNGECAGGNPDILTRRVDQNGNPMGGGYLATAPTEETTPAIAWNGSRFQTVWRMRPAIGPIVFDSGISARQLEADGLFAHLPIEPWIGSLPGRRHMDPAIACRPSDGRCLLAYARFDTTTGADRLDLRSVSP
jgi:hypothetical protein